MRPTSLRTEALQKTFPAAKPSRHSNPRRSINVPRPAAIKCGVKSPAIRSQISFTKLTRHYDKLDIRNVIPSSGLCSIATACPFYLENLLHFVTSSPADGVSTSLLHPLSPLWNPQSRCRSFPALLQLALVPLSSRIKPLLEMCLEALEHLFF